MNLIADSGSTKSEWILAHPSLHFQKLLDGINPYLQTDQEIERIIRQILPVNPECIFFYGAGCGAAQHRARIHLILKKVFKNVRLVEVDSDITGAARALCQKEPGLVGILGTGSNLCLYNGSKVTKQHGGFGYILGDEGGGTVIGKRLMQGFLNRQLPVVIREKLEAEFQLNNQKILEAVYKSPMPNRFLASFGPFVYAHRQNPFLNELLVTCFTQFLTIFKNIFTESDQYPLHLTGSIAGYFEEEVREAAAQTKVQLGTIEKSPLKKLIVYHRV